MTTSGEKQKQKQKKEIRKPKNVLFNPFPYKWPVLDNYFETKILDELESLLKSLPIKLPKRPASYFRGKKKGPEDVRQIPEEVKEEEEERKRLRSQIVCGVREVTKGLEKDDLDLFLVCRSSRPSIITKHLIPLAASRGCPALCIPEFNPRIAPLLGVTSLVAMGFKRLSKEDKSTFHDFVTYTKSVAPSLDTPWVNKCLDIKSPDDSTSQTDSQDEASVQDKPQGAAQDRSTVSDQSSRDFLSLSGLDSHGSDRSTGLAGTSNDSSGFISLSETPPKSSDFVPLTPALIKDEDSSHGKTADLTESKTERSKDSSEFISLSDAHGKPADSSESKSDKSKAPNSQGTDKISPGSSLVFPLDGPPPFVPKDDYSYLYVFKSVGQFGDDFVSLGGPKGKKRELSHVSSGSESESVEEEISGILGMEEPVAKKQKHSVDAGTFEKYRPALIRGQIANSNKKKKKFKK